MLPWPWRDSTDSYSLYYSIFEYKRLEPRLGSPFSRAALALEGHYIFIFFVIFHLNKNGWEPRPGSSSSLHGPRVVSAKPITSAYAAICALEFNRHCRSSGFLPPHPCIVHAHTTMSVYEVAAEGAFCVSDDDVSSHNRGKRTKGQ